MTNRQLAALRAIQTQIDKGEKVTYRWLAKKMGYVGPAYAHDIVGKLVERGYLERKWRSIKVLRRAPEIVEWRTYDAKTETWTTIGKATA